MLWREISFWNSQQFIPKDFSLRKKYCKMCEHRSFSGLPKVCGKCNLSWLNEISATQNGLWSVHTVIKAKSTQMFNVLFKQHCYFIASKWFRNSNSPFSTFCESLFAVNLFFFSRCISRVWLQFVFSIFFCSISKFAVDFGSYSMIRAN